MHSLFWIECDSNASFHDDVSMLLYYILELENKELSLTTIVSGRSMRASRDGSMFDGRCYYDEGTLCCVDRDERRVEEKRQIRGNW